MQDITSPSQNLYVLAQSVFSHLTVPIVSLSHFETSHIGIISFEILCSPVRIALQNDKIHCVGSLIFPLPLLP